MINSETINSENKYLCSLMEAHEFQQPRHSQKHIIPLFDRHFSEHLLYEVKSYSWAVTMKN